MPYLDYAAHSPLDPEALRFLKQAYARNFGNPHNTFHRHGREAAGAIEKAQQQIAKLVGGTADEVLITSGATEANNLAILGFFASNPDSSSGLTTQAEHLSVLGPFRKLESDGLRVEYLEVDRQGQIDLKELRHALSQGVAFASILWVNNETGVIQPVERIGELCRDHGTLLHVDASQAVGRVDTTDLRQHANLISLSGHKLGAPSGIGALVGDHSQLAPRMYGGGQQFGLRPGTLPTELISAFGFVCQRRRLNALTEHNYLSSIHARARSQLGQFGELLSPSDAAPGILSVGFKDIESETLLAMLGDVAISAGAACSGKTMTYSHVLNAMRINPNTGLGSIRVSFNALAKENDVLEGVTRICQVVSSIRTSIFSSTAPTNPIHISAKTSAL